jgi:hypothetical protein
MSITRQVTIWCDDCGQWDQATKRAVELRRSLHRIGWVRIEDDGQWKDYCPKCAAKRKGSKAKVEDAMRGEDECKALQCVAEQLNQDLSWAYGLPAAGR